MRSRLRAALVVASLAACPAVSLVVPATGLAARLVGGSEQRAIERAFTADPSHRDAVIASIRASSVNRSWAVVRWVSPQTVGGATSGARPALHSSFFHRVGDRERAGSPRGATRSDLERPFEVEVVYAGAGGESISYDGAYRSDCAGLGGFTDAETVAVSPMSWTVRYVVDLDDVLSAVRGPEGTVLVPGVAFDAAGSSLDAVERMSRTVVDAGCNGKPTNFDCTTTFHLGGSDPAADLSLDPSDGLQIGVPMTAASSGACNPVDYTLGPSLWNGGAGAALVGRLRLAGGVLPGDPYAPVRVSWPGEASDLAEGFADSPCQGDQSACVDDFHWSGTVALRQISGT
jgi:hypothetical protein